MPASVEFLPVILAGVTLTIELTVLGCLLATMVAFVLGFARLSGSRWLGVSARIFMEFFRGTSVFVQLFWVYFVLPLAGFELTPLQAGVLGRIHDVDAAGDHGDGARCERCLVGSRIDATRQSGGDHDAGFTEGASKGARQLAAGSRGVARADDGEHRPCQYGQIALDVEHRRRRFDRCKSWRIAGLDGEDRMRTGAAGSIEFGFGCGSRADGDGTCAPAAARELGQGGECLVGAAEAIDEFAERRRPDVLAADEAQAGQPLRVVERRLRQRRGRQAQSRLMTWHRSGFPRRT